MSPLRLKIVTAASLAGVGGAACFFSTFPKFRDEEQEAIWFGDRGPMSTERAVAVLPTGMCIGSGVLAATLQRLYPSQVKNLAIPVRVHEMLALPLSLLLAFRFQGSYDRWWQSRQRFSELVGRVVSIAEYISANVPKNLEDDLEPEKVEATREAIEIRKRCITLLEAYLVFVEEKLHGPGFEPHPVNRIEPWPTGEEILKEYPEDVAACRAGREPIVWCSTETLACISRLQDLGIIDGDNGSMISSSVMSCEPVFIECMVVRVQDSPNPFIVHYRTVLIVFCLTFPFAVINQVGSLLMVPVQTLISFAFLGSEFCSREMEHPFGSDKADIPVRKIIQGGLQRIRQTRDQDI